MPIQSTAPPKGNASQPLSGAVAPPPVQPKRVEIKLHRALSNQSNGVAEVGDSPIRSGSISATVTLQVEGPDANLIYTHLLLDLETGLGRLGYQPGERLLQMVVEADDWVDQLHRAHKAAIIAQLKIRNAGAKRDGAQVEAAVEVDADPDDLLAPTVELDADGNLVLA